MDKSELFIKQCDCPEVQKYREKAKDFQEGDFLACFREDWKQVNEDTRKAVRSFVEVLVYHEGFISISHRELAVWLPKQDQIQEMWGDISQIGINVLVNKFYVFCLETTYKEGYLTTAHFETMEQFWLAFYMYEKHQKIWDEDKWVKK